MEGRGQPKQPLRMWQGVEEAKETGWSEIGEFARKLRALQVGHRFPGCVLLVGPPGTECKNLLAKAVAGETGRQHLRLRVWQIICRCRCGAGARFVEQAKAGSASFYR